MATPIAILARLRSTWNAIGPVGVVGFLFLLVIGVAAAAANLIAPYDPIEISVTERFLPPLSGGHLLGTDAFGRDVLSRLIYGAQISLYASFATVAIGGFAGSLIGFLSGYVGGPIDSLLQRIVEIGMALPLIVMALAILAALGPSVNNVVIAMSVALTFRTARLARGSALLLREAMYITAARAVGASGLRILVRHLVPNALTAVVVLLTAQLGVVLVNEASLSYLGLGAQEPTATWGNMLSGTAAKHWARAPWIPLAPGLAIVTTVFAFNLLGDAVRDAWDPRLR